MFWDKAYTPSHNIEQLLQKEDVTVEEFLEDEDILQECKFQNKSIVNYFNQPDVIRRLIQLSITEPPEDLNLSTRYKHANMATEVLVLGLPSLNEKLVEDSESLRLLYSYLENEPPLNPLLSSFFCKIFSMLFERKMDQDWFLYQKTCLQLLEFIKTRENFLDIIFKHFSTTVIPDLLMQLIKEIQGAALKKGLYEWLVDQQLVPRLIAVLADQEASERHSNVADFLCDLIRYGRTMRQTKQDQDSFEPTFVGSNPILQSIESETTIRALLDVIMQPNVKDNCITSVILIVLTLIEEMVVDDSPSERSEMSLDKEREDHRAFVATIIQTFAPALDHLHNLLLNPSTQTVIKTTAAVLSPPFGMARLQICRLFTVLLKTGNEDVATAICKTDFFNTILDLFKQYCWNNFLHSEVEKCVQYIFTNTKVDQNSNNDKMVEDASEEDGELEWVKLRKTLQNYVMVECKLIPKLIDCWMHNKQIQSTTGGRRLGYMGYLIKILTHIASCFSDPNEIRALIESNLSEDELLCWNVIMEPQSGEYAKNIELQERMLANCNAYVVDDFGASLPQEFFTDNSNSEFNIDFTQKQSANESVFAFILKGVWQECDLYQNSNQDENVALDLRQLQVYDDIDDDDNADNDMEVYRQSSDNAMDNGPSWSANPWNDDSDIYNPETGFGDFGSDNFADFDSHFSTFTSDLGNFDEHNTNTDKADTNANITKDAPSEPVVDVDTSPLPNGSAIENEEIIILPESPSTQQKTIESLEAPTEQVAATATVLADSAESQ